MNADEMKQQWHRSSQDTFAEIAQWRNEHPKATLAEIEHAVDEHLNKLRAQMIQDAAQVEAPRTSSSETSSRTACPKCGARMHARGRHSKSLQTSGGHDITLHRSYLTCPSCGYGFFPPR